MMNGLYQRKSPFKTEPIQSQQRGSLHNNEGSSYLFSKALQTKKTMVVPPVKLKENLTEAANTARYPLSPGLNRNKLMRMDDLACNEQLSDNNLLCMQVLAQPSNHAPNNIQNELLCDETITPSEVPLNDMALIRKLSGKPSPQPQHLQQQQQQTDMPVLRQFVQRTRIVLKSYEDRVRHLEWENRELREKMMINERR